MVRRNRTYLVAELDLPAGSDAAAWADSVFTFLQGLEDPKARVHGVAARDPGDILVLPERGTLDSARKRSRATKRRILQVKGEPVELLGASRIQYEPAYRASLAQREMRSLLRTHADRLRASYLAGLGSLRRIILDVTFTIHDPPPGAKTPAWVDLSWHLGGGRLLPCATLRLEELREAATQAARDPSPS